MVGLALALAAAVFLGGETFERAMRRGGSESEVGANRRSNKPTRYRGVDRIPVNWEPPGEKFVTPIELTGRVFSANGESVNRAEVAIVAPGPYELRFTGTDGAYMFKIERPGKYLLEARLTLDLGRVRKIVEIPETGVVAPVDFHLYPAGQVVGEVMAGEIPVLSGNAELGIVDLEGDVEWDSDVSIENGYFSFPFAPEEDVPLRLLIRTPNAYMEKPITFEYEGERVDLGKIQLKLYPSLRLVLKLPDGSLAAEVMSAEAADVDPAGIDEQGREVESGLPREFGYGSRYILREKESTTRELALWAFNEARTKRWLVKRRVELVHDQLLTYETSIRPGPFTVRRRLVDENGEPIRARLQYGDRKFTSGEDGYFTLDVPHGGLFTVSMTAMTWGQLGWVELPSGGGRLRHAVLVDADQPTDVVFDIGRRLLVVGRPPFGVAFYREANGEEVWGVSQGEMQTGNVVGVLSKPLPTGRYRYRLGRLEMESRRGRTELFWNFEHQPVLGTVTAEDRRVTVVDLR